MFTIRAISADNLEAVWPVAEPILRRATDTTNGRYSTDDLKQQVEKGNALLWVVLDGEGKIVAASSGVIRSYPRMKALLWHHLAGDGIREWGPQLSAQVENVARQCGCERVEFAGRSGWGRLLGRILEGHGYETAFVAYEKVL